MTAGSIAAALDAKRSGKDSWMARCPAHDDRSPSLHISERDGKVLLKCFTGCDQADVIAALRARGLWPEKERPTWTPAQRRDWARERREMELHLPAARYWRRAVLVLLECELATEKAKLFGPTEGPADADAIASYTGIVARLERASDDALVGEFRAWAKELPDHCARLVQWARDRESAEIRATLAHLEALEAAE